MRRRKKGGGEEKKNGRRSGTGKVRNWGGEGGGIGGKTEKKWEKLKMFQLFFNN